MQKLNENEFDLNLLNFTMKQRQKAWNDYSEEVMCIKSGE